MVRRRGGQVQAGVVYAYLLALAWGAWLVDALVDRRRLAQRQPAQELVAYALLMGAAALGALGLWKLAGPAIGTSVRDTLQTLQQGQTNTVQ